MNRKSNLVFLAALALVALCLIALVSAMPAQALSGESYAGLVPSSTPGPTGPCAPALFALSFSVTANFNDTPGFDRLRIEVTDGNGNLIAQSNQSLPIGPNVATIGVSMASVTARPLTARLWDTNASFTKIGAPRAVAVVDPAATYVLCASLPYVVPVGGSTCAADGRINSEDCAGPVALYCDGDELQVYNIDPDTGIGWLAFTFSAWPDHAPAANTLLASHASTELWHLKSGEFQVNADQGEGKTYAFLFNGCPYDGAGYHANLDPNE